jgi:hypothetical protein
MMPMKRTTKRTSAARKKAAREMAGQEIDRVADTSLPADEREKRKRRLIKGPREFRDLRKR